MSEQQRDTTPTDTTNRQTQKPTTEPPARAVLPAADRHGVNAEVIATRRFD